MTTFVSWPCYLTLLTSSNYPQGRVDWFDLDTDRWLARRKRVSFAWGTIPILCQKLNDYF
jgi:hypothetical protein